ncbi:EthD family reductase [Marinobacter sp. F3R08]|uniref:EthD family reductase n=1 Tax=Marinobacter sp. F3R08 TaxID=2841559 RepID=UPI001C0939EA|nr:EthD family reductase [Marinobacter sp. F3R08]MBU2952801.1 EthD family reductase [Marinobacter sp. F3R08]
MIKVSVLYPKTNDSTFDIGYYRDTHMALVRDRLGDACKRTAIESGLAGGAPGQEPTYIAMGHLYFESVDQFQSSFGPHAREILGDIPNFTNVEPTVQISEVIE